VIQLLTFTEQEDADLEQQRRHGNIERCLGQSDSKMPGRTFQSVSPSPAFFSVLSSLKQSLALITSDGIAGQAQVRNAIQT
jgi:hypothetical protein